MSSASRGSGTRRRMKLRSRDCSRLTTSEIRWSCSVIDRGLLSAWATYICRRRKERNISGFPPQKGIQEPGFGETTWLSLWNKLASPRERRSPPLQKENAAKAGHACAYAAPRSEERRVGKESRVGR